MKIDASDLANRFAYHSPRDDATVARHQAVREVCLDAAAKLIELLPDEPSREASLAITHLEEVMFWANAAIARPRGLPTDTPQLSLGESDEEPTPT